jgi:hypothetical protein
MRIVRWHSYTAHAIMFATHMSCVLTVLISSYSYFIQKANILRVLKFYQGDSTFNWNMNWIPACMENNDSQADKILTAVLCWEMSKRVTRYFHKDMKCIVLFDFIERFSSIKPNRNCKKVAINKTSPTMQRTQFTIRQFRLLVNCSTLKLEDHKTESRRIQDTIIYSN